MPNPLSLAWVKNVYSLRIPEGKTSDKLHTASLLTYQFTQQAVDNLQVFQPFVQAFTPLFYTPKIAHFNPLNSQLYPQSTTPINKKKKKILGRNT